jgi:hypothetical protein
MTRPLLALIAALGFVATATAQVEIDSKDTGEGQRDYNIRLGNLTMDLVYVMSAGYVDNTNRSTSADTSEEGVGVYNGLQLRMDWPLKDWLRLQSGISGGYRTFLSGAGEDGWIVQGPDADVSSRLALDMRLSETSMLTVADSFYHQLSTVQVAGDDNTKDFNTWNNRFSITYVANPTELTSLQTVLAHDATWADDSDFEFVDRTVYSLTTRLLWQLNTRWRFGPDVKFSKTEYWEDIQNESEHFSLGVANVFQLTARTSLTLSTGWQKLNYDNSNAPAANEETDGFTGSALLHNVVSEALSHQLRLAFTRVEGSYNAVNYSENTGVNYSMSWRFARDWSTQTQLGWTRSNESGDVGEIGDQYSGSLRFDYHGFDRATLRFLYGRTVKRSNLDNRDYEQDAFELQLRWNI